MSDRIQVKETKTIWPSSFEGTIDDMIAQLRKLREEGWELIDGDYFRDSYAYVFIKHRPETFDEYSNRVRTEERNKQLMLERRRKQSEEILKFAHAVYQAGLRDGYDDGYPTEGND